MINAAKSKGITLGAIAQMVDGQIRGDASKMIVAAAAFDEATPQGITFVEEKKLFKRIAETKAAAVIVPQGWQTSDKDIIEVQHPKLAFARVMQALYPAANPRFGISPQAVIGAHFTSGPEVAIGPCVVIGNNVKVGSRVIIHAGAVIGDGVRMGDDVEIHSNVTISDRCCLGSRVVIHAGTVIGSDGFGFTPDGETYFKIPQIGIVQIDDDVELGAGNTIDRATFGKTWIQKGVKTDNMVHVAHNVTVGENTLLVAQVGISGSVRIGKHAILAGQVGVSQHLEIGDNAVIGPQSGLMRSVPAGEIISGSPGISHKKNRRITAIILKLPELNNKIKELEKRIRHLEGSAGDA